MLPSPTASSPSPCTPIGAIVVAVPARDEVDTVAESLLHIGAAASRCAVPVAIVLAADSCTDDTAGAARRAAGSFEACSWHVVEGSWSSASRARAAAISTGLHALGAVDPAQVWMANTDADCAVPVDWLDRQLALAAHGADAVAGIVRLDPRTTCPQLLSGFVEHYGIVGATHRHVHAANLGIRADVYTRLGGWCSRTVLGEEHALWRRLTSGGFDVRQPTDVVVTTSCRTVGRVRGGFASSLARLVDRSSPVPPLSDQDVGDGRSRFERAPVGARSPR